jgi:hypothetical protein
MSQPATDLGALFDDVEHHWRLLRNAALGDLSAKKNFKRFIRVRNDFHEALSQANEALYAAKDALMLPELLDMQEWLDS